jgi:hypothetical protein
MMGNFFTQGILHITDFEGYDHMLFLLALAAPFSFKEWKPIVWLATAFTVGHSISLALTASDVIRFPSALIEALIPITIALTALGNMFLVVRPGWQTSMVYRYSLAVVFGLIHGMGFSGFFRMISSEGESFLPQLVLFNLGVEAGQVLIVLSILGLIAVLRSVFSNREKNIILVLSSIAFTTSMMLLTERM